MYKNILESRESQSRERKMTGQMARSSAQKSVPCHSTNQRESIPDENIVNRSE